MGYISKDIAVITEPDIIALSAIPNFVQFASKPGVKTYLEINIKINMLPTTTDVANRSTLVITSAAGDVRTFKGTVNAAEVGGNVFYISADVSETAENLRQAMLSDTWIKTNFEIVTPFVWVGAVPANGSVINIKSKGAGIPFNIVITAPSNVGNSAYLLTAIHPVSINNDSISGEQNTAEIELDVYINPTVFLGEDDRPTTTAKIGHYLTTLSKTYSGSPLWFELNALFDQYPGFKLPPAAAGWFNPETVSVYRFVAKVKNINSYAFYQSNALYVVNGYGRLSEALELSDYVYDGDAVKLLSNKPKTPYIRGQREYLNFIIKDNQRGAAEPIEFSLRVAYRAYSTAGDYLGVYYSHQRNRADFTIVNSCVLNIDAVLDLYPTAGIIKVALSRGTSLVSNDAVYEVLPSCLHKLQQVTFLNRLGGWDSFNFDAEVIDEIKPTNTTYNKTITPDYKIGDSQETVYGTSLANPFTLIGAPVYDDVADWLKELAAARVILNNNGEYIIIEDFELRKDPKNKNMHTPTLKFRLSEKYTND